MAAAWLGKPSSPSPSPPPATGETAPRLVPLAAAWLGQPTGESPPEPPFVRNDDRPRPPPTPQRLRLTAASPSQSASRGRGGWRAILVIAVAIAVAIVGGLAMFWGDGDAPPAARPTAGLVVASAATVNQQLLAASGDGWRMATGRGPAHAAAPQVTCNAFTPLLSAAPASVAVDPAVGVAAVLGLQVRRIVIDPGHGGRDWGAKGPDGTLEKDLVLDIAQRLRTALQQQRPELEVRLTRDDDTFLSLKQRVDWANRQLADLFISLHVNALPTDLARNAAPFVEAYFPSVQDSGVRPELLQQENSEADYAIHEFRQLAAGLESALKQQESARLATQLQRRLFAHLRTNNPQLVDAGVKSAPFVVLLGTNMPSVLVEVTSLSHPDEERRLGLPSYRQTIATGLALGLMDYLAAASAP